MAYWIHESGNKNNSMWTFFQCDYLTDIASLPTAKKEGKPQPNDTVCKYRCASGSQCFCQEDGSMWFLGKDTDRWIKRKISLPSGGSGDIMGNDIEPIPFSSIQSLFL